MCRNLICLCCLIFLVGCFSNNYSYTRFWKKEGFSYHDAVTIEAQCKYAAVNAKLEGRRDSNNQDGAVSNEVYLERDKNDLIEACMVRQGFREGTYRR